MWPSFETASRLYDLANTAFIASLVVGVAATVLLVWMGNVKEGHLRRDVATAGEHASAANEAAARANERANKLENENLLMRKEFSPRRITPEQHRVLVALLSKIPGTINIQSMSDSESGLYAGDILKTFTDAGWRVGTKEFPLGEIWHGLIFEDSTDSATVAVLRAFLAAGVTDCHTAKRGKPPVTILVGGKPPPF